jgi:hypothetical protein
MFLVSMSFSLLKQFLVKLKWVSIISKKNALSGSSFVHNETVPRKASGYLTIV